MECYDFDSSEELIIPTKSRYIREIYSERDVMDKNQSASDFEWEERNDESKLYKFISVSSVNKDIINLTRKNFYDLYVTEETHCNGTNRFGKHHPTFQELLSRN
ncbi:hypothetical protein AVEN_233627-1 [Araneus ventricosus]|uniref:Uncharacterized protein n=1 Tax=Araneus ventricosus TaxID=182803 RepID=A0A4Y2SYH5_ARAVE|nr:hypothetical protein AVEN_233627-1 [Araneus ventricosus]